ncbi:VOC family protein [Neomegalonema perideroedes]|uniref:VOC family protein n=1 Tax=Neomegalonema perideroedes TaxID=217219 RepID=UPI000380B6F9|nr:VOC family protein [Neomegalonema perideroedes]
MRFGYMVVYAPDVAATVAFYEKAFGVKARFVTPEADFAEMETGATALAFAREGLMQGFAPDLRPNRPEDPPAGAEIAFVVEEAELEAAWTRAVAAGAAPLVKPERTPWGQMISYVRDLNGVLVEICGPVPKPA